MTAAQTATYAATLRWVAKSADRAAGDQLQAPLRGIEYLRACGCGLFELEIMQQLVGHAVDSLRELSAAAERLRARLVLESLPDGLDDGRRREALRRVFVDARWWDAALAEVACDRRFDAAHALELEEASQLVGTSGIVVVLALDLLAQAGLSGAAIGELAARWQERWSRIEAGSLDPVRELRALRRHAS